MAKESKKKINLHAGHRQRVRKRFLDTGLSGFEEHEILELILFYCIPRADTNEIAHRLIYRFGSIKNVLNAPVSELKTVEEIGENAAVFIKLLGAIIKEDFSARENCDALSSSERIGKFIMPYFSDLSIENVIVVALDAALKPISAKVLSEGSSFSAKIAPAKVARFLITNGAHGAIIAHNHPSGLAVPSIADIRATTTLKKALDAVDIKLVDHLIVVKDDFVSIRDSGDNIYTTM